MLYFSSENDELWNENDENVTIDEHNLIDELNEYNSFENSFESMKIDDFSVPEDDDSSSENKNLLDDNDQSTENENLSDDDDSFDDNDADILQEELYSDDELLSNFDDVNLAEGKLYIIIYNIFIKLFVLKLLFLFM